MEWKKQWKIAQVLWPYHSQRRSRWSLGFGLTYDALLGNEVMNGRFLSVSFCHFSFQVNTFFFQKKKEKYKRGKFSWSADMEHLYSTNCIEKLLSYLKHYHKNQAPGIEEMPRRKQSGISIDIEKIKDISSSKTGCLSFNNSTSHSYTFTDMLGRFPPYIKSSMSYSINVFHSFSF